MASSQTFDEIHPDESISQGNYDFIDLDDDIYGEQTMGQGPNSLTTSADLVFTTSKKCNLFYVRNEDDKEAAAAMLKVFVPVISLTIG